MTISLKTVVRSRICCGNWETGGLGSSPQCQQCLTCCLGATQRLQGGPDLPKQMAEMDRELRALQQQVCIPTSFHTWHICQHGLRELLQPHACSQASAIFLQTAQCRGPCLCRSCLTCCQDTPQKAEQLPAIIRSLTCFQQPLSSSTAVAVFISAIDSYKAASRFPACAYHLKETPSAHRWSATMARQRRQAGGPWLLRRSGG